MIEGRRGICHAGVVFSVSLALCLMFLVGSYRWNERLFYDKIAAAAAELPKDQAGIMKALKDTESCDIMAGREILSRYGYHGQLPAKELYPVLLIGSLLFAGSCTAVFLFFSFREKSRAQRRIQELTEYLREVERGNNSLLPDKKQDGFSSLEDEIYKTVSALRESRRLLQREKEELAKNLADISHQLKTPLTSLSILSDLLLSRVPEKEREVVLRMEKQTERLSNLSRALLVLSRADAGVLPFEIRQVPVSELLANSLETVLPLLEEREQHIVVSGEQEGICLSCDLGWTGEAIGNLLKNASEHAPEGSSIMIRVWENPVFTGIAVEDEGRGFSEKDLPHLFERFYRGEGAGKDYAGIGLALARVLIERQKGEIHARNRREGGAEFLVKFYKNI